mmetsp:Transcript_2123/g.2952  ORF Transcript_2123/g.2952 Transcript_2123/m.2952 type:complete len:83 (-) Transcript_2123:38-286(-)
MTIETNAKLKRPKSTLITGMSTRILDYKKKCWKAKGKIEDHHTKTPLLELAIVREFEKGERSKQKSTPPGFNNVTSYFGGDK